MSPRTTEAAGPTHDIHAAPPPAAAIVEPKRAPSSTTAAPGDRFDAGGVTRIPASRQRRAGKPLSSGWKSLAWTKPSAPPAEGVRRSASPPSYRESLSMPMHHSSPGGTSFSNARLPQIVDPIGGGGTKSDKMRTAVRRTTSQGDERMQGSRRQYPLHNSGKRSGREGYLAGIAEGSDKRSPNRSSLSPARTTPTTTTSDGVQQRKQQQQKNHSSNSYSAGGSTEPASEVEGQQAQQAQQAKTLASFLLTSKSADSSVPLDRAVQYLGSSADVITSSMPNQRPRQASTDEEGNVLILERSLSDTSIVTASDFAPSKPNKPIILTHMKDDDAIEELVELLARGKGLSVVKHATGLGGSKSRKMLRFNNVEGNLSVCGMLPPYFKTKIPVRDIDRVDAKWCCVVVHAKGRSPLRLEVDSFATADILRVGLMAASRTMLTPPAEETPPPPPVINKNRPDPEQGLSSVRPGHHASQIYDPDAALSVAALLAKEMEEERKVAAKSAGGVCDSAPSACRPSPKSGPSTIPALKRSLSMTSVASTNMVDHCAEVSIINNRRSMPRGGYGGVPLGATAPGEGAVLDTKAALRRLYAAIDGRGMVAVKRNPNGKGRSRVMVRSRSKEGAVGWAHVLPPFSKKFIAVKELIGASRSSRVVTVTFKGREPVLFETDRLTDALILEQGFVSLAFQQKNERTLY